MARKFLILVLLMTISLSGFAVVKADETDVETEFELEEDYPWRYHAEPMEFKFGNMIDSHQQSHLDSNGVLHGFIYIYDTGEDTVEGYPVAEKAHCPTGPCMVGWVIKGVKISATLVNKSPRVWQIDPADIPTEPGYYHFHWIGDPHSPGGPNGLVVNQEYEGYLMKRIAKTSFFWLGGPGQGGGGQGGSGGGCGGHDTGGGDEGGCSGEDHTDGGCSGGSGGMSGWESEGGCSDGGAEGGCSGGGGDMGGGDMGSGGGCSDGGDEGGCSGHDGEEGGCSGEDHTDGGCSGGDGGMGGGSSGHGGGRLVMEGLDSHINIVTEWDGTWHGDGCDD